MPCQHRRGRRASFSRGPRSGAPMCRNSPSRRAMLLILSYASSRCSVLSAISSTTLLESVSPCEISASTFRIFSIPCHSLFACQQAPRRVGRGVRARPSRELLRPSQADDAPAAVISRGTWKRRPLSTDRTPLSRAVASRAVFHLEPSDVDAQVDTRERAHFPSPRFVEIQPRR